jgi:hypothetical protein
MARDSEVGPVVRNIMSEVEAVAAKMGIRDAYLDRPVHRRRGENRRA